MSILACMVLRIQSAPCLSIWTVRAAFYLVSHAALCNSPFWVELCPHCHEICRYRIWGPWLHSHLHAFSSMTCMGLCPVPWMIFLWIGTPASVWFVGLLAHVALGLCTWCGLREWTCLSTRSWGVDQEGDRVKAMLGVVYLCIVILFYNGLGEK